ncbi:MAG: hypothetical protein HQL27_01035 [Candidatus Omnitrophica bacterium]|nr:hypothetical protein [Candidatus Omnitrophota bacterium]
MLAKKFALGFGIAVLLPMVVHYGVSTFNPAPKWRNYYQYEYYNNYEEEKNASPEEKAKKQAEIQKKDEDYRKAQNSFGKSLFLVAIPVGLAAIIFGSLTAVQAIGTGLMFGGIFTIIDGYCWYWSELQDWMRFVSLLVAFIVLIYIGYRKMAK